MKLRKFLAMLLAAAMTFALLTVSASAESIEDTAKSRDSGDSFSIKLNTTDYHDYKVKLTKSGDLKITLNAAVQKATVIVYNSDGNKVLPSENASETTTGSIYIDSYFDYNTECSWNKTMEKYKGTLVYKDLDKGTYYIRIYKGSYVDYSGTGKTTVKFTFPGESSDKSDAEISMLQITLEEDDDIVLSAVLSESGEVTWSSSKESVATVSSRGKVRAKNPGTAVITAKCGKSSQKIQIKVIEDD